VVEVRRIANGLSPAMKKALLKAEKKKKKRGERKPGGLK